MEYCLAEAVRHFDREFLKGATSMTLSQDHPPESDQTLVLLRCSSLSSWFGSAYPQSMNSIVCDACVLEFVLMI